MSLGVELRQPRPKRYSLEMPTESVAHTRVDDEAAIEKKYSFGEVLGSGSFGVVREVTDRASGGRLAMKIVQKDKPGSSAIQLLVREVEVLKRVNHPNIIQLEEVFETAKKMYLIMELCKGGELSEVLRRKSYFKEEEAKAVMHSLTEAVVYMHDNDMVHRDLKLENVLLSEADPTNEFNIKVTDFGLAHMKGLSGCDDLMHTKCGTLYYMAPEVLSNKHEYTKMCDVWSLGVIMYTLLCGRVPFQSDSASKLEELISQGELKFGEVEWINVSSSAKDLIRAMLCVDTTRRLTARRVLDDSWFTGQAAKMNALELMRRLHFEENASKSPPPSSSSTRMLETVKEGEFEPSLRRKSEQATKKPAQTSMRHRAKSTSAVSGVGNLKHPSTSSLLGGPHTKSGSLKKSLTSSSTSSPKTATTSTTRRPSTGNHKDRERKYNSPNKQ